ncbi:MAG: hypothetical protein H6839_15240 [Planctomycetes bacterium]|nr:hypothetical protein [Planctomycetota bacterium]
MKACRTIWGALAWAIGCGLGGAVLGGIIMAPLGYDGMRLGTVMGSLPAGLMTLIIKYPRWEADL